MKKLFRNYTFELNKNEKKLISSFCKQSLKQMGNERQYFAEIKAFNSILNKLNSGEELVKLTKDEKRKLTFQLKQNIDYIKKQMDKSWFIKKWLMKSLFNQYKNLFETHFEE